MALAGNLWFPTQSIYRIFGSPVGAVLEGGAWILTVILAFAVRKRGVAFKWTVICAVCMVAAQVIWWAFVNPVNQTMAGWVNAGLPEGWQDYRARWEYAHAVRPSSN